MSSKKIYLAKHVLASGFDVEYVKSHLSRLPNTIIVESGMVFEPEECDVFVIVPNSSDRRADNISLSKNVYSDLVAYMLKSNASADVNVEETVYIYQGSVIPFSSSDVETSTPTSYYIAEDYYLDIEDESDYNNYGYLTFEINSSVNLLENVGDILDIKSKSWLKTPRHFIPQDIYAVPPVPTIEERLLKKSVTLIDEMGKFSVKTNQNWSYWSENGLLGVGKIDNMKLLLLRRK